LTSKIERLHIPPVRCDKCAHDLASHFGRNESDKNQRCHAVNAINFNQCECVIVQ